MPARRSSSQPLGPAACESDARKLEFIEDMTANAAEVQQRVLSEILKRNSETEYLQRYKMGGSTERKKFKKRVPVVAYEDLKLEIQRIADGDRSPIISAIPISEFLTSSGTSAGERKLMPTIEEELDRKQLLYSLLMPVMNVFVRRKNVLLSIESDKTDEAELQAAVDRASKLIEPCRARVVEYTSQAYTDVIPGHYVIYWELMLRSGGEMPGKKVLELCCHEMEEAFNTVYRQSRVDGSVGPLEIRVVRHGTFEELMDYAISRGASINQYKAPRCVTFQPIVELLDSRVISTHFSSKLPSWAPRVMHA